MGLTHFIGQECQFQTSWSFKKTYFFKVGIKTKKELGSALTNSYLVPWSWLDYIGVKELISFFVPWEYKYKMILAFSQIYDNTLFIALCRCINGFTNIVKLNLDILNSRGILVHRFSPKQHHHLHPQLTYFHHHPPSHKNHLEKSKKLWRI